MDHFRSLYKANPMSQCKRKEAHEIRAHKRSELYTSTRNISPSPSRNTQCSPAEPQKENLQPLNPSENNKTPLPDKSSNSPSSLNNKKISRQKAHILKFLAWKTEKAKQAQIKEKSKRAPFVVGTRSCAATAPELNNFKKSSFAPANHIFRPPASIQSIEFKVIDSNNMQLIHGTRQETYHFIATPKKQNNNMETGVSAHKNFKKPIPVPRAAVVKPVSNKTPVATRLTKMPLNSKPLVANVQELAPKRKVNPVLSKPKPDLPPIKRSTFKAVKKSNSSISNAFMAVTGNSHLRSGSATVNHEKGKFAINTLVGEAPSDANQMHHLVNNVASKKIPSLTSKELNSVPHLGDKEEVVRKVDVPTIHPIERDKKSRQVRKAAMVKPNSVKTPVHTTRVTRLNPKPKVDTKVNVLEAPPKQKTNTAPLKPKSVLPPIKRPTFKNPKKCSSSISNAFMAVNIKSQFRGRPPTIKLNGKSVAKTDDKPKEPIPETPTDVNPEYPFINVVTSTKRKSLSSKESSANSLFVEMDQLVSPVDDATTHPADGEKFNFLRYSVVQSDASKPEDEAKTKVSDEVHVTPDKAAGPQTPTTYLSPYVSVSRGKVGIKIEREKRNSVYMAVDKSVKEEADTTAKARHTMATVHYYRNQLKDEINRLNGQCDAWQQYKEANTNLIDDSGSDMINVTIGQTKLLTTKKLKQFGDLIDRCENGAMGKQSLSKGDRAKPILTEDLEGFWSMVGLQIENVDKRFANLQRWKENNWKDPDEVPARSTNTKSNLKKMKKPKPGNTTAPNRDLQKILRNAQAAFLRQKTANSGFDEDVILTPSKSRQVLIRDRRSRSAAATVITVNTPKLSRKSLVVDQTTPTGIIADTKVLPHINSFRKSMNLFKSTLLNQNEKKSPSRAINCGSPLPPSRKSILKTPGSICRPKSVIFNSPTLQFTREDKLEDESSPESMSPASNRGMEEDEERTYSLRTRKIKLRDLADIIIPE